MIGLRGSIGAVQVLLKDEDQGDLNLFRNRLAY